MMKTLSSFTHAMSCALCAAALLTSARAAATEPPIVVEPAHLQAADAPENAIHYIYAAIGAYIVCISEQYSQPDCMYTIHYYYDRGEFLYAVSRAQLKRPGQKFLSSDTWTANPGDTFKYPLTGKEVSADEMAEKALEIVENAR